MVRGSSAEIIQTIDNTDVEIDSITALRVTFAQPYYNVKVQKELDDVTIDSDAKTITIPLTQEDTLQFRKGRLKLQLKWIRGEDVINTEVTELYVDEDIDGEVIE